MTKAISILAGIGAVIAVAAIKSTPDSYLDYHCSRLRAAGGDQYVRQAITRAMIEEGQSPSHSLIEAMVQMCRTIPGATPREYHPRLLGRQ